MHLRPVSFPRCWLPNFVFDDRCVCKQSLQWAHALGIRPPQEIFLAASRNTRFVTVEIELDGGSREV